VTLAALISELRLELAHELPLRLHAGQPSSSVTRDGIVETAYGHITGLPFSRPFERFIDGEHGGDFLASDCFAAIRDDYCRPQHWREQHTGSNPFDWNLCARLAIAAVELRQPLSFIAAAEDIDVWLARNLLTGALQFAADWRTDRRKGVVISDESRRQLNESEAINVALAREHSVIYEQRVWEAMRRQYPFLPPWESELARRRAFHGKHCWDGCALLVGEAA